MMIKDVDAATGNLSSDKMLPIRVTWLKVSQKDRDLVKDVINIRLVYHKL
jgi:hypothetical protein